MENVFEKSKLVLSAEFRKGKGKQNQVKFLIATSIDDAKEEVMVEIGPEHAKEHELKEVPDHLPMYRVTTSLIYENKTLEVKEYSVWPLHVKVDAVWAEGDDKDKAAPGFAFHVQELVLATPREEKYHTLQEESGEGEGKVEKGSFRFGVQNACPVDILPVSPWEIVKWVVPPEGKARQHGRVRECKVRRLPYTAKLYEPTHGAKKKIKQYVNLPEQPGKNYGQVVTCLVGADVLDRGLKGDKIYIKVEFAAKNCTRKDKTSPRAVKTQDPGGANWNFTPDTATTDGGVTEDGATIAKEIEIKEDGAYAKFEVHVGRAGGDVCTIKVGVTDTCEDYEIEVTTWRRVFYELMLPQPMSADCDEMQNASGGWGYDFGSKVRKTTRDVFGKASVEFVCWKAHSFGADEGPGTFYEASYFGGNGRDVQVLTSEWADSSKPVTFDKEADKLTVQLRLTDKAYSTRASVEVQSPVVSTAESDFTAISQNVLKNSPVKLTAESVHVSRATLIDALDAPAQPEQVLQWEAVFADKEVFKQADNTYDHPGLLPDGTPRSGNMSADWLTPVGNKKVEIKIPTDAAPGTFIGPENATHCKVQLEFATIETYALLGVAGTPTVLLWTPDHQKGFVSSMVHEVMHMMGMTIFPGNEKAPPGMEAPKHVDDDPKGVYYRNAGTGEVAGANGLRNHAGSHCATGYNPLTDVEFGFDKGESCLMYGSGDETKFYDLCDTCTKYLKGRNLEDLKSDWGGRADEAN